MLNEQEALRDRAPVPSFQRGSVVWRAARSGCEPRRHGLQTAQGTCRAAFQRAARHLLAVEIRIRVNRAALRIRLERGDLGAETSRPPHGGRR
jgi:hypothetical protein